MLEGSHAAGRRGCAQGSGASPRHETVTPPIRSVVDGRPDLQEGRRTAQELPDRRSVGQVDVEAPSRQLVLEAAPLLRV